MASFEEFLAAPKQRARIVARTPGGANFFDQVLSEIIDAAEENPKIRACEPHSIIRAVCRAVSWGLVIGEGAFLIPRAEKRGEQQRLTAMQGYRGKIELIVRHGVALRVDAFPVYENEAAVDPKTGKAGFEYEQGSSPWIRHQPILDPASRGRLVGAYACATIRWSAPPKLYVMHRTEIDKIRLEYSQKWDKGTLDEHQFYGPKTCVHQLAKQLPMKPKIRALLTDDLDGAEEGQVERMETVAEMDDEQEMEAAVAPGGDGEKRLLGAGPVPEFTSREAREPTGVPFRSTNTRTEYSRL